MENWASWQPFQRVSLRRTVWGSHEWSSPAKKRRGLTSSRSQTACRNVCGFETVWELKCTGVLGGGETRKEQGGFFLKVTFRKWILSQHTLWNPKRHEALWFLGSSLPGKIKSPQNLGFDDGDVISTAVQSLPPTPVKISFPPFFF